MVARTKLENGNGHRNPEDVIGNNRVVTVCCKIPNGVILQCWKMVDQTEQTLQGPRSVKVAERLPESYKINGNSRHRGADSALNQIELSGGYALTRNVPKDFWDLWLSQHKDMEIVRNRLIFAFAKAEDVKSEARNCEKLTSGLEPLTPTQLDRHGDPVGTVDERLRRGGTRSVTTAEK